ncbi:agamous-like MADS-box protein AGL29 [Solanum dulcamara]|uniref:agamous-like MADS-box protein AGL29 n=1 Tax=Solanum dulcamara TaxID=45834 RepID=UPI002485EFB1|nr:agamous-like MADS-box protein AGL29 [Solanum dulcamara]
MDKRTRKGRQKIEMKLIESKETRTLTFLKTKKGLFKKADEYSTLTGADVGVLLFSPSGRPYSYGSTNIHKEVQALEEKDKEHPRSDILTDKHMLEQYMASMSRLEKLKKDIKGKCVPEPEEE